jgi:4-hydroxy-2-oxoglutarate aldolase
MNMKKELSGVYAPITTPFDAQQNVDYAGLKKNMEKYAKSGIHGYLALGSNGENKSLTWDEKIEVLKIIMEGKAPEQKVMAGCICESTFETIALAKELEKFKPDFLTLLPPSYFKKQMTDAALIKYFTDVASAVSPPCLVYNAPQFSAGIVISTNVVKEIAKHPNIVGVKDSSNAGNMDSFLMAAPEDFACMAGSANFFVSALIGGATGGIISLANAFPQITLDLYDAMAKKEYEKAFAINKKVLFLNKTVSGKGGVAAVKAAMDLAGFAGGLPRLPLPPMEQADIDAMAKVLKGEGLI